MDSTYVTSAEDRCRPDRNSDRGAERDPYIEILVAINRAGAMLVEARDTCNALRCFRRLAAAKMQLALAGQKIDAAQAEVRRSLRDIEVLL